MYKEEGNSHHYATGVPKEKMHRLSFSDGRRETCLTGELIHSDVCGPMSYMSIGGERYFVVFKDDFSGFVQAYLIKKKSEVFGFYRLFAAFIKNQTGLDILTLRSDGGKEYDNNEFTIHLNERGGKHEMSCPYTLTQNGVSERANRTIMEAAHSMLHSANAPLWLWGEAIKYAVFILNRIPSKEKLKTPFELLFHIKPNVANVKIFGSRTFVLDLMTDRRKIDGKSLEGDWTRRG